MNTSTKPVATPERLRALVGLRIDLAETRVILKQHLEGSKRQYCKDRVDKYLEYLHKSIEELSADIASLAKQDALLRKKTAIIASVPGIDQTTAGILSVDMPWVGKLHIKTTTGSTATVPYTKDNGMYIDGDRAIQRRELYSAAIHASKNNAKLKAYYEKQLKDGKTQDEALISVMFKLIVIITAMLKKGTHWVEE